MATIALCIPAYNAAIFLPRLLTSANTQTIPFDEILVYDDCSTDNTGDVARQYGAIVFRGEQNSGCSFGKNKLAQFVKSDWIHFHDADDELLPNFTMTAQKWIGRELVPDIILMHYHYKDFVSGTLFWEPDYNANELAEDPVKFTIVNKVVNFALIKKSSFLRIGGFNTNVDVLYNEDRAFYTKAAIEGLRFGYERELTCINYFYAGSMSARNKAKCSLAAYHVWMYVIEKTKGKYNKEIAEQLLNNATFAASANDWKTVMKSVKLARNIYLPVVPAGSAFFKNLYNLFPYFSFIVREILIKYFTRKRQK